MKYLFKLKLLLLGLAVASVCLVAQAQPVSPVQNSSETGAIATDIINCAKTNNINFVEEIYQKIKVENNQLGADLIGVLTNSKSSNLNQCVAAYYLGEMHCAAATDVLAGKIVLQVDMSHIRIKHLVRMDFLTTPATDALVKIGNPSIPAVTRNLAESDDAQVRELSLKVLCRIEGDKDIVQLRLQKALAAEKDSQKQARLQRAFKSLAETSFAN